jgi:hypothetical protein
MTDTGRDTGHARRPPIVKSLIGLPEPYAAPSLRANTVPNIPSAISAAPGRSSRSGRRPRPCTSASRPPMVSRVAKVSE